MGDWSELPPEILALIAQCMDNCFDLVHFRSVCSSWRSSAPSRFQHVSLKCPLPPDEGGLGDDCHIVKRCVYLLKSPNSEVHPRYWLFKLREEKNGRLVLQDLFDGRSLSELGMKYPSLSLDTLHCQVNALKYEHIACYTEWCEPLEFCLEMDFENVGFMQFGGGDNDFAIFGTLNFERLAMYRSLDQCWTVLDPTTRSFQATTSFNGKFYGVDYSGKTTVVKPSLEVTSFQNSMSRERRTRRWLIPSGKELLLAELWMENVRFLPPSDWTDPGRRKKIRVEISKLDEEKEDWVHGVQDLGGRVLFLAVPSSFSCLATDIPGIKGNSIFFKEFWGETLDYSRDLYDHILVFDLAEQRVRSVKDIPEYVELFQSPPGGVISNQ